MQGNARPRAVGRPVSAVRRRVGRAFQPDSAARRAAALAVGTDLREPPCPRVSRPARSTTQPTPGSAHWPAPGRPNVAPVPPCGITPRPPCLPYCVPQGGSGADGRRGSTSAATSTAAIPRPSKPYPPARTTGVDPRRGTGPRRRSAVPPPPPIPYPFIPGTRCRELHEAAATALSRSGAEEGSRSTASRAWRILPRTIGSASFTLPTSRTSSRARSSATAAVGHTPDPTRREARSHVLSWRRQALGCLLPWGFVLRPSRPRCGRDRVKRALHGARPCVCLGHSRHECAGRLCRLIALAKGHEEPEGVLCESGIARRELAGPLHVAERSGIIAHGVVGVRPRLIGDSPSAESHGRLGVVQGLGPLPKASVGPGAGSVAGRRLVCT